MNPLIVNIKRNSLDDGPGIRTAIFFKGCPLSCVWCQNPETKSAHQELSYEMENCIDCKACIEVCDPKAIDKKHRIDRLLCNLCGKCIGVCQNNALKYAGQEYTIAELYRIILKDKTFYDNSGGGVTFTGGEPTLHMNFLNQLLLKLKEVNIHICLETCGYYNREKFEELILPYVDLIYIDIKILDSETHRKYCNVPNELILRNFEALIKNQSVEVLPRIPLVPEVTSTKENLSSIASYLRSLGIKKIGLLPYNPLWLSKSEAIGASLDYKHKKWMTQKEKQVVKEIFTEFEYRDF
ncbi:MAG: glycyl-radical enzyme activating protein [Promethearchaeota archaeon]|nr:MAG: glycyl-radical enzyme activating protein [Candidatus Lokiarchaeota archaeon]